MGATALAQQVRLVALLACAPSGVRVFIVFVAIFVRTPANVCSSDLAISSEGIADPILVVVALVVALRIVVGILVLVPNFMRFILEDGHFKGWVWT